MVATPSLVMRLWTGAAKLPAPSPISTAAESWFTPPPDTMKSAWPSWLTSPVATLYAPVTVTPIVMATGNPPAPSLRKTYATEAVGPAATASGRPSSLKSAIAALG
jgi:hypothetical protein